MHVLLHSNAGVVRAIFMMDGLVQHPSYELAASVSDLSMSLHHTAIPAALGKGLVLGHRFEHVFKLCDDLFEGRPLQVTEQDSSQWQRNLATCGNLRRFEERCASATCASLLTRRSPSLHRHPNTAPRALAGSVCNRGHEKTMVNSPSFRVQSKAVDHCTRSNWLPCPAWGRVLCAHRSHLVNVGQLVARGKGRPQSVDGSLPSRLNGVRPRERHSALKQLKHNHGIAVHIDLDVVRLVSEHLWCLRGKRHVGLWACQWKQSAAGNPYSSFNAVHGCSRRPASCCSTASALW